MGLTVIGAPTSAGGLRARTGGRAGGAARGRAAATCCPAAGARRRRHRGLPLAARPREPDARRTPPPSPTARGRSPARVAAAPDGRPRPRAGRRLHRRGRHGRRPRRRRPGAGLVYLDRHADLNVPASTIDGALDWMGVAHLLDVDGAVDELAGLAPAGRCSAPDSSPTSASRKVTPFEQSEIDARGLPVVDLDRTAADPRGRGGGRPARPERMRPHRRALRRRRGRLPRRAAGGEHRPRDGAAARGGRRRRSPRCCATRASGRSR